MAHRGLAVLVALLAATASAQMETCSQQSSCISVVYDSSATYRFNNDGFAYRKASGACRTSGGPSAADGGQRSATDG
jgi:hypothetical protein